ncbi:MerR family transcriptional regulator [Actinomadura fulvescens]|uniref:HTH merR-type domain-containing protein n=1 Tax=Actinomadura fulvescens TaxID=46160 RepID=A0ABP6CBQ6_9ACTN
MESTWTITELADRAVVALAADGSPRANGRVRDLPNERLIRWYTTIGLVDPPLGRRGRTALYGPRHLLQLVAIKRRQAAGRSIAEIQAELTGLPDATLQEIAELTDLPEPPEPLDTPLRERFWAARPPASTTVDGLAAPRPMAAQPVQGVRLAPDLTLLLNVPSLGEGDLAAIETAARPLLDELRRRDLIGTDTSSPSAAPYGRSS